MPKKPEVGQALPDGLIAFALRHLFRLLAKTITKD